jgi:hypothetical protein
VEDIRLVPKRKPSPWLWISLLLIVFIVIWWLLAHGPTVATGHAERSSDFHVDSGVSSNLHLSKKRHLPSEVCSDHLGRS